MRHAIAAAGTVAVLAWSYGLAIVGEPSSAWLWCFVLRLCN